MQGRCVGEQFLQLYDAVGICTYVGSGQKDVSSSVAQLDVDELERREG
jgi:hypothetical protein